RHSATPPQRPSSPTHTPPTTRTPTLSLHDALPICELDRLARRARRRNHDDPPGARLGANERLVIGKVRLSDVSQHASPLRKEERSEEHTSELQSLRHLVCRLLLEKKKKTTRDVPCR